MATENPIDPVTDAKEKVDDALENLESVVIDEKIAGAESTAQIAVDIALDSSNESREAIEIIKDELIEHEESDEWQRQKIHELMILTDSLRDELSILRPSLMPEPILETLPEPEPITETILPVTNLETPSEIKTEALNESVDENPAAEILPPVVHGKIRLV